MSIEQEQRNIDIKRLNSEEHPSTVDDGSPACCNPIPCGFSLGSRQRTFKDMTDDWEEERRGWTSL
jgi:hypothetical protein